jgi:hypothetical protein
MRGFLRSVNNPDYLHGIGVNALAAFTHPVFASLDHPLFASEKRVKKELTKNSRSATRRYLRFRELNVMRMMPVRTQA